MADVMVDPEARTTRGGWVLAALGATLTTVICVMPGFLVGALAVQISDELGFSPAGLGLAVGVTFGVSALTSVPAGRIVERIGARRTSQSGILLAAVALAGIGGIARNYATMVLLLVLAGVANALGQISSNASVAHRVPARRQGLSFGIKQAAIPLATMTAGLSVPVIALTIGWRWGFLLAAMVALGALFLVPRDETGDGRTRRSGRTGRSTGALALIGVAAALAAGASNTLGAFLVDAAVFSGLAPGVAGLALSTGSFVNLVVRLVGGWAADRRSGAHLAVVAGSLVVGAGGLALLAQTTTVTLWIGVVLAFGLGWSWPGLLNFAVVQLHPQAPAAATSITQAGVYAGACFGPLAFGAIAAGPGYGTAWACAAGSMLLAAAAMLVGGALLRRTLARAS